jgi:hypothetical protein
VEVGTAVGVVVEAVVVEGESESTEEVVVVVVAGARDQGDTVSVVGEVVYRIRCIYRLRASVDVELLVVVREGTPEEREFLHLGVLGMDVDRAGQHMSQEGVVVASVVADTRTDPGKDYAGGEVFPAVG